MKKKMSLIGTTLLVVTLLVSSMMSFADTIPSGGRSGMDQGREGITRFFDSLEESGVLTQAEMDAIKSYMEDKTAEMKTNARDVQNMTEAERQAIKEGMDNDPSEMIDELIGEGLLTTDQAASIKLGEGSRSETSTEKPAERTGTPDNITVEINGVEVISDVKAFVDGNNRTMIELRSVAEALGADIGWNSDTKTVSLILDVEVVEIQIGQANYKLNGAYKEMDTAAVIEDGRTMVPVRVVSEALGATVTWEAETKTVVITQ